jgi:GTPase Era involved in 16S rRNA processing
MTEQAGEQVRREVRDLATRGTEIGERLAGLEQAVRSARGRLDDTLLEEVGSTVDRAAGRLRLSAHHTVVAIAGATGSGKSSTYNALVGLELSSIGVRRPTTSWASACVWGSEGAEELLDWLGIPPRHRTMRDSMLDSRHEESVLDGVVLMDLPDHDSTEVSHHLEVDRLVEVADLIVWVLDPQKYADAALHNRYLAPYRTHAGVMLVVLNQIDMIPEDQRQSIIDDVQQLLDADGLSEVKVLPISAQKGIGMDALRSEIERRVEAKRHTSARVEADIAAAAARLEDDSRPRALSHEDVEELVDELGEAAGVASVAATVGRRARARAGRATMWPPARALGALRPDPRRHLAVDLGEDAVLLGGRGVEPAPKLAPVSRELVDSAVRRLATGATHGLAGPWAEAIARTAAGTVGHATVKLQDRLGQVDLRADRLPGWVRLIQMLQAVFLLAAVGGAGWWLAARFLSGVPDAPRLGEVGLPVLLVVAGVLAGAVLAVVPRMFFGGIERASAEDAEARLRRAIESVVDAAVVRAVEYELTAYADFKDGLGRAVT